jgi:putative transposase
MARAALRIEVRTKDRKELEKLLSGGVQQVRVVLRAVALLQLAKGVSAPRIAGMVPLTAQAIRKIGHRYQEGGLERALYEKQRPGAEALLEASQKQRIIAMVCSDPPEGFARWTVRYVPKKPSRGDWCHAWVGKPSAFCSSATTSVMSFFYWARG